MPVSIFNKDRDRLRVTFKMHLFLLCKVLGPGELTQETGSHQRVLIPPHLPNGMSLLACSLARLLAWGC